MVKDNFLIIEKTPELLIPELVSTRWTNSNAFVPFGADGNLGEFIYRTYSKCSVLKALVDFTSSKCEYPLIAKSLILYGFAVIDDTNHLLDSRFIRFTADRSKIQYQRYRKPRYYEAKDVTMIFLDSYDTYPIPFIYPCLESASALVKISEYGLSQVSQGFTSSALISLNNGTPDEDTRREIQHSFEERFTGSANAGRIMLSFSDDKEHAPEVHQFSTDDFFSKFSALKDFSYENLFSTFRATPALVGIRTNDSSGALSEVEYDSIYKLFYSFTVEPLNNIIANAYVSAS